jgi:pimeloyl-ACP methyl ester carboxylesterase
VQFIDCRDGQMLVRCYGKPGRRATILLHDAPGSGLALQPLAQRLAGDRYVLVPDLPGNGESDAPDSARPILDASAASVQALADALDLHSFSIGALGCGCAVAALLAASGDRRIESLHLAALPAVSEDVAQAIAPQLPLTAEGSHWVKAWLMVRDSQIYDPWYAGTVTSQRSDQGNFDADWLHEQTFALMKSRTSYQRLPQAAYRFDAHAALRQASVPVHLAADRDLGRLLANASLSTTG